MYTSRNQMNEKKKECNSCYAISKKKLKHTPSMTSVNCVVIEIYHQVLLHLLD